MKYFKVGDISKICWEDQVGYFIYAGTKSRSDRGIHKSHIFEDLKGPVSKNYELKPKGWDVIYGNFFTSKSYCWADEAIIGNILKLKEKDKIISIIRSGDKDQINYIMECIENKTLT